MADGTNDRVTTPSGADVTACLDGVEDEGRREDARAVVALIGDVTGAPPRMWGPRSSASVASRTARPTARRGSGSRWGWRRARLL